MVSFLINLHLQQYHGVYSGGPVQSTVPRPFMTSTTDHFFSLRRVEKLLSALAVYLLICNVKRVVMNWWTKGNAPLSQADNPSATVSGILSVAFSMLWRTHFCFHKLISPFYLSWLADLFIRFTIAYSNRPIHSLSSELPHLLTRVIRTDISGIDQASSFHRTRISISFTVITYHSRQILCYLTCLWISGN